MKIPLRLPCQNCGATDPVDIHLDDDSPDWVCQCCGKENSGFFELEFTIGYKILARSEWEHNARKDYSMSIILSAMAFECELSRLFNKWTHISALTSEQDRVNDEEIETMLRKYASIRERIEAVGKLLDPRGLDDFVRSSARLRETIESGFPSLHIGSLAQDFQRTLFWPRNRILHTGYTGYTQEDSARCHSIARLALGILHDMDLARRTSN